MKYTTHSGERIAGRRDSFGAGHPTVSKLRRRAAGACAATLVIGAMIAGPGVAYANDGELNVPDQTVELSPVEQPDMKPADVSEQAELETPEADVPAEGKEEPLDDVESEASELQEKENEESAVEAADVTFDSVSIVQDRQYQAGAVDVAYTMAIPNTVKSGDTIQLTYQAPLDYDDSVKPVLSDNEGVVVATGELTDAQNRVITFTFTDYVDKNKDVKITGTFAMIANDPEIAGNPDAQSTTHEIVFTQGNETFADTLVIDPPARTPLTKVFNYGVWTGEDKGHIKPENAILWTANSPEGEWESMTVEFEPAATSTLECSTLKFYTQEVPDGDLYHNIENDNDQQRTLSGSLVDTPTFVEDVQCDEERVVVSYKGHVDDNFLYQFTVEASVKDRDTIGHFGSVVRGSNIITADGAVACPDPSWPESGEYIDFAPSCALTDTHWYNFVARDAAGGEGEGVRRDASIEIQKYSTAEGLVDGDYDATPGKQLKKGASEQITFEITNTGEEPLSEIVLVDQTITGPDLEMTKCALEGVTLDAGQSVTCTGVVTVTEPGQHGDSATVTAVARGGQQVVDSDLWWGVVAPDPVIPPEKPEETDPGQTVKPSVSKTSLALTGGDSQWLLAGIAALILATGGVVYGISRRQSKQH